MLIAGCALVPSPEGTPGLIPAADAGAADDARLQFDGIAIERVSDLPQESAVSDEQLVEVAAPYFGTRVTLGELRTIATTMEGVFRDAGYPYMRVILPPQQVEDGQVRFQVIEGRIEGLAVLGTSPTAKRQIEARLEPLEGLGPVPVAKVERAVGLLSDVPGLKSRVALARGAEGPGTMRMIAEAEREGPRFLVNYHNWGAETLGREGVTALARVPGVATYGDEFQASFFTTRDWGEQFVGQIAYERGLTAGGLKVRAEGTYGEAEPSGLVQTLGATSESVTGSLEFSYPVYLDRTTRIDALAGFDYSDLKGELFQGTVLLSEDKVRTGFLAFDVETSWMDWDFDLFAEARKGLDVFASSKRSDPNLARTDAHPDAFSTRGELDIGSPIYEGFKLDSFVMGQFSRDPLMAVEEMAFGNYTIVRGYDPGAATADAAIAVATELSGFRLNHWNNKLQTELFGFFDFAEYWNRDAVAVERRTLASFGGGVRATINDYMRAEFYFAEPLRQPRGQGEELPSSRIMFSITANVGQVAEDVEGLVWNMVPEASTE